MTREREIEQLRAELAQAQRQLATTVQRCGYCDYRATGGDAFNIVAEHIKSCPKHPLAETLVELAQAREELVTADAAMDAVQALWCSPAETKRQDANLAQACARLSAAKRRTRELYDIVTDRNRKLTQARTELKDLQGATHKCERRLAAARDSRNYWHETSLSAEAERDKARKEAQAQSDLVQHEWLSPCQKAGLEQKLTKAEAQVASCLKATRWLWGYYDGNTLVARPGYEDDIREAWDDLLIAMSTRATSKLLERLATLDAAEKALAGCGIGGIYDEFDGLADAIEQMAEYIGDPERCMRQEAGRRNAQLKKHLADARRVARLWFRRAQEAELEAHVHSKACDEMAQTVHTERALRQEAEALQRDNREAAAEYLHLLCFERQLRQKVEQRATRAEALVGLVATEEAAALLERLGRPWYEVPAVRVKDDFTTARKLAEQIREALEPEVNDEPR